MAHESNARQAQIQDDRGRPCPAIRNCHGTIDASGIRSWECDLDLWQRRQMGTINDMQGVARRLYGVGGGEGGGGADTGAGGPNS